MEAYNLLIDGQMKSGALMMDVLNPATGAVLAECARADAGQLNDAVAAAKRAFPAWAKLTYQARRGMIHAIADALAARTEEFAHLLTSEQGKPLYEAMKELYGSVAILKMLSSLEFEDEVVKDTKTERIIRHRTPLGVVAAITPWNNPMTLLMVKIASALVAGNTVVAKPAPTTPLTNLRFAEICSALLPAGVFNMITDANDLGAMLTSHPDVAKISFTGSTVTGKRIMQGAASSLKRLTLELGGNDAAIVLDDADMKTVVPKLFAGAMLNAGQVCLAIKRVYVHDTQYDAFCNELADLADAAIVGDGLKQGTQMGPLQNKMQYDKVRALIDETRHAGRIIAGGSFPDGPGYFIRPTIVRDIDDNARLVREEQFGPVLPVLRYTNIDDAIERANATEYGLGGTVWSADSDRALAVARRIDSGTVWVNTHMMLHPDVPAGGAKESGIGVELGMEGLAEFTQSHILYAVK
jgi:acyl-CoA reductase-like NAD-dependent aldehyde dehydrogenase